MVLITPGHYFCKKNHCKCVQRVYTFIKIFQKGGGWMYYSMYKLLNAIFVQEVRKYQLLFSTCWILMPLGFCWIVVWYGLSLFSEHDNILYKFDIKYVFLLLLKSNSLNFSRGWLLCTLPTYFYSQLKLVLIAPTAGSYCPILPEVEVGQGEFQKCY